MAPSGIFDLPVVAAHLTETILRKRLLAYSVFSESVHLRCSSLLCSIKAFAVAMATMLFTIPPSFRNICKYSCTFLPISLPRSRSRPVFFFDSTTSVDGSGRPFNTYSYLARKAVAVLSPNFKVGCVFLNFRTAFIGPYTDVYFPIRKGSLSVKEL